MKPKELAGLTTASQSAAQMSPPTICTSRWPSKWARQASPSSSFRCISSQRMTSTLRHFRLRETVTGHPRAALAHEQLVRDQMVSILPDAGHHVAQLRHSGHGRRVAEAQDVSRGHCDDRVARVIIEKLIVPQVVEEHQARLEVSLEEERPGPAIAPDGDPSTGQLREVRKR